VCTLVQAQRLCTGRTAHRRSIGIAILFLDHGTRRGWGVSVTPRPLFTPGKNPVPIVQEAGWAPGPVWTGVENHASTGIRSPDRPACSQSLYRLCYPAHIVLYYIILYYIILYYIILYYIILYIIKLVGRDSSVGTATRYGLDGPRMESRWGRDFPLPSRPALGLTQPPIQWVPELCRG